jgi:hypothetical protein
MPELVHNETRLLKNATILADTLALELRRVLAFTFMRIPVKSHTESGACRTVGREKTLVTIL